MAEFPCVKLKKSCASDSECDDDYNSCCKQTSGKTGVCIHSSCSCNSSLGLPSKQSRTAFDKQYGQQTSNVPTESYIARTTEGYTGCRNWRDYQDAQDNQDNCRCLKMAIKWICIILLIIAIFCLISKCTN